jgi:hypothetical protein
MEVVQRLGPMSMTSQGCGCTATLTAILPEPTAVKFRRFLGSSVTGHEGPSKFPQAGLQHRGALH